MNFYVFRINYGENYGRIKEEIRKGRLRQGWGSCDMDIRKTCEEFSEAWGKSLGKDDVTESYVRNKYNNIKNMLNMKKGDIIVVPKLSFDEVQEWWKNFTILECTEEYSFETINIKDNYDDFGHYVGVKILCSCNYEYNRDAILVSSKFRSYQRAVNNIYNVDFCASVDNLIAEYQKTGGFKDAKPSLLRALDTPTVNVRDKYLQSLVDEINKWAPGKLEDIICELFEKQGYAVINKHNYDGKGGDIDVTCNSFAPGSFLADVCTISENDDITLPEVRIQAKNKKGKDGGDLEGVKQLLAMPGYEKAINILINTTPEFTDDAKQLAGKDVVLINGKQFAALLVKYGLDILS